MNLKNIVHLIPYDGTGGVESAARSVPENLREGLNFSIEYIFTKNSKRPFAYFTTARKLLVKKPDLIILSLWRSCIVGLMVWCFSRKSKIVLMLHYPEHVHLVDKILTILTSLIACEVWADSQATLDTRLSEPIRVESKIISFMSNKLEPVTPLNATKNFIFWGRLHRQKGLEQSIKIFSDIKVDIPDANFIIIGPDGGEKKKLLELTKDLNIADSVSFLGEKTFYEIKTLAGNASFYLQTSILEGMAMSVVEAMQLGLIPIVNPVGEIKNYCQNNLNAILVGNNNSLNIQILNLYSDKEHFQQTRKNAIYTWLDQKTYADSIMDAASCLLGVKQID